MEKPTRARARSVRSSSVGSPELVRTRVRRRKKFMTRGAHEREFLARTAILRVLASPVARRAASSGGGTFFTMKQGFSEASSRAEALTRRRDRDTIPCRERQNCTL
jgi:hypothetical protein